MVLSLLRRAWAWYRARAVNPTTAQGHALAVGTLVLLFVLVLSGVRYAQRRSLARDTHAIEQERTTELKRLAQVRKSDSAAAFQAGRLYQQRLDADKLRQQDEIHTAARPVRGGIILPDLRVRP